MKKIALILSISISLSAAAQTQPSAGQAASSSATVTVPPLDKSPMDMAYFPADYPMAKTQNRTTQPLLARVIYSRPQRDERMIFGELIQYGEVWRLGANEATEIEFFKDARVNGKKIPKGRYTLYAIPNPTSWTIIINKDTDTWGAFIYDEKKDLARAETKVQTLETPVEPFSMSFVQTQKGASLVIAWETTSVSLPIEFK